jgi:hypothetical protein
MIKLAAFHIMFVLVAAGLAGCCWLELILGHKMIQQHDVRAGCCWLQLALLVAAGYSWFYMFSKHTFSYP